MNGSRILLAAPLAAVVVALGVTSVDAKTFSNVPPHHHFVKTATGELVEVGPNVCDHPELQHAFNRFHKNVHVGVPGTQAFDHEHNDVDLEAVLPCVD